jgi:hypothetical protein
MPTQAIWDVSLSNKSILQSFTERQQKNFSKKFLFGKRLAQSCKASGFACCGATWCPPERTAACGATWLCAAQKKAYINLIGKQISLHGDR